MEPQQQQSAPRTPLYRTDIWCLPEGSFGIFGYRKAEAVVYPGWLIIYRKSDHTELKRVQLTPDLQMKQFLNYVRIARLGGQKFSFFDQKHLFFTVTMWSYALFFVGVLIDFALRYSQLTTGDNDSNLLVQSASLLVVLAALGWMATGMPKGKALILACLRGAGIA
jgi:hypothetical protein